MIVHVLAAWAVFLLLLIVGVFFDGVKASWNKRPNAYAAVAYASLLGAAGGAAVGAWVLEDHIVALVYQMPVLFGVVLPVQCWREERKDRADAR